MTSEPTYYATSLFNMSDLPRSQHKLLAQYAFEKFLAVIHGYRLIAFPGELGTHGVGR